MLNDSPEMFKNKIEQGLIAMRIMGLITDDIYDNFSKIIENTWNNGNFQKVFIEIQGRYVKLDNIPKET
jgi:hypothetical protein